MGNQVIAFVLVQYLPDFIDVCIEVFVCAFRVCIVLPESLFDSFACQEMVIGFQKHGLDLQVLPFGFV